MCGYEQVFSTNNNHNNKYKGTPWWSKERTVSVRTIGETKFARCDIHTVKSENDDNDNSNTKIINDWLFLEEMDAINVAVVTLEGKLFPVFEQMKYAIPGTTLSPVGGFIDPGEAPWESAKREVMEELGLGSQKTKEQIMGKMEMEITTAKKTKRMTTTTTTTTTVDIDDDRSAAIMSAFAAIPKAMRVADEFNLAKGDVVTDDDDWIYLGRYRTAANRGGGFIYTYLLKNAVPILPNGGTPKFRMTGDDEAQLIKLLSLAEIKEQIKVGGFQEVKWAATYALAVLHLMAD